MRTIVFILVILVIFAGCRPDPKEDWTVLLHTSLAGASRLRVRSGGTCHSNPNEETTLLDIRDTDAVAKLIDGIAVDQPKIAFCGTIVFCCMCCGNPTLEFYRDDKLIAALSLHHGQSLRWPSGKWTGDGHLTPASAEFLINWLNERGVTGPKQEREKDLINQKKEQADQEKWINAMPSSLKPFWLNMEDPFSPNPKPKKTNEIRKAIFKQFPDQKKRILVLLEWYGSGAGPWSGFPGYECTAEELLLAHKTENILAAIQAEALTPRQIEGTARLFGGWNFSKQRTDDLSLLPGELKQRLLAHSLKSDDKDKRDRAQTAFGMKDKDPTR